MGPASHSIDRNLLRWYKRVKRRILNDNPKKGRKKLSGKRLRYEFPPTRHVFTVSKT